MVILNLMGLVLRKNGKLGCLPRGNGQQGFEMYLGNVLSIQRKQRRLTDTWLMCNVVFCIYDKTTRGSQEVALIFKDTVYVHNVHS